MSYEAIPVLLGLSFLVTAGIAFVVDAIRRVLRDKKR
jgi:hypothetical protein